MHEPSNTSVMDLLDDLSFLNFSDYFGNSSDYNATDLPESPDSWCELEEHRQSAIAVFQTSAFCLIFLMGVTGNCLVIATFALYRRLRLRSTTDIFLFHLALADLLLLLTLPFKAVDTGTDRSFPESFRKTARVFHAVNTHSGLLLLACISVDRYVTVVRAHVMLRLRGKIPVLGELAAVAVWLVAVLLSLPEILLAWCARGRPCDSSERLKVATKASTISVFCLSLLVMVSCYGVIARVLCGARAQQRQRRGKRWVRQRTLKLMVALVLVFLALQLPHSLVLLRKAAAAVCEPELEYVTCTLAYARCCLNPLLYALIGVRFRGDVARLFHDSGCPCVPKSPPPFPGYSSSDSVHSVRFQFSGEK